MFLCCNFIFLVLAYAIHRSLGLICDIDHQCPAGMECRFISYLPGTKACIYKSGFSANTPSKRNGRCPTPDLIQPNTISCNGNQDCSINKKCCSASYGGAAYCVDTVAIPSQPTVTPIIVGDAKQAGDGFEFSGAATLIQSNGFNILVDTGTLRMTGELFKGLWSQAGLTAEDIDTVVRTHGHPDHSGTTEAFSNVDLVVGDFIINGPQYKVTPMRNNQSFFLNSDKNVEIVKTPGHTMTDISVIVRNVQGFGKVAVVGDLITTKNDGSDMFAQNKDLSNENRKKIVCMVDYIVPGHGPMYQVDADQRSKFGCSTK